MTCKHSKSLDSRFFFYKFERKRDGFGTITDLFIGIIYASDPYNFYIRVYPSPEFDVANLWVSRITYYCQFSHYFKTYYFKLTIYIFIPKYNTDIILY